METLSPAFHWMHAPPPVSKLLTSPHGHQLNLSQPVASTPMAGWRCPCKALGCAEGRRRGAEYGHLSHGNSALTGLTATLNSWEFVLLGECYGSTEFLLCCEMQSPGRIWGVITSLKCNIKGNCHPGCSHASSRGGPLCTLLCLWQELGAKDFSPVL